MQFLDRFDKHDDCATMILPRDLNDPARVREMIERLGLELAGEEVRIAGQQNRTPGVTTTVTRGDEDAFREVVGRLPGEYLEIFHRPPYAGCDWVTWLQQ